MRHLLTTVGRGFGKVAVIVNELGDVGIDGTLLSGPDTDIMELTSGCICCSLSADFLRAVEEVYYRTHPDFLFVEATGVAQPADMILPFFESPLKDFCRLTSLMTVVDARFFKARHLLGSFYERQLCCADTLILNKIDRITKKTAAEIEESLREINPQAVLLRAQHCVIDLTLLLRGCFGGRFSKDPPPIRAHNHEEMEFQSFSFEDTRPFDRDKLVSFLDALPHWVFRLKGWVRFSETSALLNYTGDSFRFEPSELPRRTSLVFVGRNCNTAQILAALKECLVA
jgi:G3E family GTPase